MPHRPHPIPWRRLQLPASGFAVTPRIIPPTVATADLRPSPITAAVLELVQSASKGHGAMALLLGIDGTGKTIAAEALARATRAEVLFIDLSRVVSKYIGETEKNLELLFARAEAADVQLFFDEADALFGKRTEVGDDHDRYANAVISYLLQRIEASARLAVLATNQQPKIDVTLLERFRVVWPRPTLGT